MSISRHLANLVDGHAAGPDGYIRLAVDAGVWTALAAGCAGGLHELCALWADDDAMRMALSDSARGLRAIVSLQTRAGRYPSVAAHHPPALRLERAMRDLYGVQPIGLPDPRPWLDHGRWPGRQSEARYEFLPTEGEGLHQIPVGPVHAGIIEPGHFRFTANGETVVRLEERLGYVHKGVEGLMAGAEIEQAARIVGRISGDSTVAYAWAFARAVEAALGWTPPPRAVLLRGVMAELERLSHHINDVGAICNDASVLTIHARCTLQREDVLAVADACFGHRLMMDRVVPGGVAADLSPEGVGRSAASWRGSRRRAPRSCGSTIRCRRCRIARLPPASFRRARSPIRRRRFRRPRLGPRLRCAQDLRLCALRPAGFRPQDADRRRRRRASAGAHGRDRREPQDPFPAPGSAGAGRDQEPPGRRSMAGEGAALVEAFRGDVFVSVRVGTDGRLARVHARDASWFQWPLLEAAIEGNIVADFPLCNKSFNCSYSGHDL